MRTGCCEQQHQRHFQSVARKCYVLVLVAHCVELGMRLSRNAAAAAALAAFAAAVLLLCLGRPFPAWALRPTLSWGQQEVLQHARQRVSQLQACMATALLVAAPCMGTVPLAVEVP